MTEDKMVGWHHQLDGHEFEQTLGDVEGQGGLACCIPWDCKQLDTTERLNNKGVSNPHTHIDNCSRSLEVRAANLLLDTWAPQVLPLRSVAKGQAMCLVLWIHEKSPLPLDIV